MTYFTKDYLQFFKELTKNNHKDWFDENRKRYKTSVKDPFSNFVNALIDEIHAFDTQIMITSKEAVFRINRDIRFSKDKTPYKNNNSAIISPKGRKDKTSPGIYIQFNHESLGIYGGLYMCDTKQLKSVRQYIIEHLDEFNQCLNDKEFVKKYGQIHGEKNKRIDKIFVEHAEKQPLLYNKQFYYYTELDPKIILSDHLMETIMEYYHAGRKMKDFLADAINHKP